MLPLKIWKGGEDSASFPLITGGVLVSGEPILARYFKVKHYQYELWQQDSVKAWTSSHHCFIQCSQGCTKAQHRQPIPNLGTLQYILQHCIVLIEYTLKLGSSGLSSMNILYCLRDLLQASSSANTVASTNIPLETQRRLFPFTRHFNRWFTKIDSYSLL